MLKDMGVMENDGDFQWLQMGYGPLMIISENKSRFWMGSHGLSDAQYKNTFASDFDIVYKEAEELSISDYMNEQLVSFGNYPRYYSVLPEENLIIRFLDRKDDYYISKEKIKKLTDSVTPSGKFSYFTSKSKKYFIFSPFIDLFQAKETGLFFNFNLNIGKFRIDFLEIRHDDIDFDAYKFSLC